MLCVLWGTQAAHGIFVTEDRIIFPLGSVHNRLGVMLGLWYEDIKWGSLDHRIRARVLSTFDGELLLRVEQNIPYPASVGVYHAHDYISRNTYDVRYLSGQDVRTRVDVKSQYQGEAGVYYRPSPYFVFKPGLTLGFVERSTFMGNTTRIVDVAAKVNALFGKRSFHPEEAEGYVEMQMLKLLHSDGATTFTTRLGGQMPLFDPDFAAGAQFRFQWSSEMPKFWFFQPNLGGVEHLAAFSELAFLDKTLFDLEFHFNWRVYQGLLLQWIKQIDVVFNYESGMPLSSPGTGQYWDSVGVAGAVELKNNRSALIQLSYSPTAGEASFFFTAKQYL